MKTVLLTTAVVLSLATMSLPASAASHSLTCQGTITVGDKTGTVMQIGVLDGPGGITCDFETTSIIGRKIMKACGVGTRCLVRVIQDNNGGRQLDDDMSRLISVWRAR